MDNIEVKFYDSQRQIDVIKEEVISKYVSDLHLKANVIKKSDKLNSNIRCIEIGM